MAEIDKGKLLREREIVNIFMTCGIFEHIAKDILRIFPHMLNSLYEIHKEDLKQVFREAMNFLEQDGVPEDWLSKQSYLEWYKQNKEWVRLSVNESDNSEDPNFEDLLRKGLRKEYYLKTIAHLLFLVVVNLPTAAKSHRKMLVRYITSNKIHLNQLATALQVLSKVGSGIIDVDDFEKQCGIDKHQDLFGYSLWKRKDTEKMILHVDEKNRQQKKQEKLANKLQQERELAKEKEEQERERQRLEQAQLQLVQAQRQAERQARKDKTKKVLDARVVEDEEREEMLKKKEAASKKQKEKRDQERKSNQRAREQEQKETETAQKQRENDYKERKEERYRQQRMEIEKRALERQNQIKLLGIT